MKSNKQKVRNRNSRRSLRKRKQMMMDGFKLVEQKAKKDDD